MSDTKTTTALQAPPDWAIALTQKVVDGFSEVEKRLDTIETNVDLQGGTVRDVQQRMTAQELRLNTIEERVSNASLRVKQGSAVDLTHEAAIAGIKVAVEALAQRPDTGAQVLAALEKLAEKPMVKRLTSAIIPVLLLAISLLGVKLQAQMAKLEAVAPAPAPSVVYVPVAGDGGAR